MWVGSETSVDYLNCSSVAESVVELSEQATGRPLLIGVSGAWGVGKSSLMRWRRAGRQAPTATSAPWWASMLQVLMDGVGVACCQVGAVLSLQRRAGQGLEVLTRRLPLGS